MYDTNKERTWKKDIKSDPDNNNNTIASQGVTNSSEDTELRNRARTVYQNDPAYGQVDENGYAIDPPVERDRARTVYQNDPAYGQVDENGYAIDQGIQKPQKTGEASSKTVSSSPPSAWKKGVASPSTAPKPSIGESGTKVAWTGKFISQYGGISDKVHGLIFKRTDGSGELHHFTPEQAEQLRKSNSQVIKESMQNGSQGKDVKVTFSVDNGRGSWSVEPTEQNRRKSS